MQPPFVRSGRTSAQLPSDNVQACNVLVSATPSSLPEAGYSIDRKFALPENENFREDLIDVPGNRQ